MVNIYKKIIVWLFNLKKRRIFKKKISGIYSSLSSIAVISNENIKEHRALWSKLGSTPDLKWYKVYSTISGIDDPRYITEYDYYAKIEPTLNNRSFSEAFCDKNHYHKEIDKNLLPKIFLRNIHGQYYTQDYKLIDRVDDIVDFIPDNTTRVLFKKSYDSGGGRDIVLFSKTGDRWLCSDGRPLTLEVLQGISERNFIIQEYIVQHPWYRQFNPSSVNTVRLYTYRSVTDNRIIPLHSVLRIGKEGSIVDNMASGGVAVGIGPGGVLNQFGIDKAARVLYSFNGIDFKDKGPLFSYDKIVEAGLIVAQKYYYHRLLGFDFCINEHGEVKLIEINNRNNEINFFQMNNGPLFREYTEEIIEYCKKNKKHFLIDFEYLG